MSAPNLYITRYNLAGTAVLESFGSKFNQLEVRCNLPGWLEKLSFIVRARNRPDALNRKDRDFGSRIVVADNDAVIAHAYVYAVDVDGIHVRYECTGAWRRHLNQFYVGPIDPADDIATVLKDILSTNVPAVVVRATNFDDNATTAKDLFRREIESGLGVLPQDAVKAILQMRGPSETNVYPLYDYYTAPQDLLAGLPQLDMAYYRQRDMTRTHTTWYIRSRDLLPGDAGEHSHIYDYQSTVTVAYGKVQGTATGGSANLLIDTTKNFAEEGVRIQDLCTHLTDNLAAWVVAISTTTNPNDTLSTPGLNWGGGGDSYSITLEVPAYKSVQASGTVYDELWTSVAAPYEFLELNSTQATQLAGELVQDLSNPILQQPFTIGSNRVRTITGGYRPAWWLLREPSYMRIVDNSISNNADNIDLIERIGLFTTALDYSHDDRTMTVTPTQPSDRLDVRLQSAGILSGQGTEPAHRDVSAAFRWGPEANWYAGYYTTRAQYEYVLSLRNYGGPRVNPYFGSPYQGSWAYNPNYWQDRERGEPWFPDRRG
jgi:hypothetical protein